MNKLAICAVVLLSACGSYEPEPDEPPTCRDGYVLVEPLEPYTDHSFCVSQYEMRDNGSGIPVPNDNGEPWHIPRNQAQAACELIDGRLPTNSEWQTMARQAESVAANWSGGSVGIGTIATSVTLTNGAVLYNLGNGVWEHVSKDFSGETGSTSLIYLISNASHPNYISINGIQRTVKEQFGPKGDYHNYGYDPGLGILTDRYSQSIMRGGDDVEPGLFGTAVNHGEDDVSEDIGFRCVTD